MASVTLDSPASSTARDVLCLHCRTPLAGGAHDSFCCRGCRHVYELLSGAGLERYYALRGDRTLAPVAETSGSHEAPWLEVMAAQVAEPGLHRITLDVQGLQCGACVWLIEVLFRRQQDGHAVQVNPALGRISFLVGPQFALGSFVRTVEELGYRLGPARKLEARAESSLLLRTGVCLALALNTMLLSAATYFGLSHGKTYELVRNASFAMTTLSALIGGSYFVDRAIKGLRQRVLHLDLPIALGMGLAYLGSVWSLYFGGASAAYLDTVSVFIALMLVGRLLQERLVEKNKRQLLESDGASGLLVRRVRDGHTELVACPALRAGDTLLVCPGEIVPVRSVLETARAQCTLDWINGESEPRAFVRGDELTAGSINAGKDPLRVTARVDFHRSDLDLLLRDDGRLRARLAGDFWDVLARVYVGLVLLATAVGALIWVVRGASLTMVLDVSTAVLVVTCPCAFGIATPLAYELAVLNLRRRGLFVRDGSFFDRAAAVKRIVFDKTGTLTTGTLALREPEALGRLSSTQRNVLYSLSAQSNHPKSVAVAQALVARHPDVRLTDASVREVPGRGMECKVDGRLFRLGDAGFALSGGHGERGTVFSCDGALCAVLDSCEVLRPDAARELSALRNEGYELWMASGDEQGRVSDLARVLGLVEAQAIGNLRPEDKRALIERLDRRDTMMIGDGINDGPALSRALCAGTPAVDRPFVPARADFYFLTPGLVPVRAALHVSRAVRRVVRAALWFATAYNVFAVAIAYAGFMRPWLAAVLMPASSLLVLTYTAFSLSPRRRLWKP